jgi:hypothetical protein
MDDTAFQLVINLRAGIAPSTQRGKCGQCGIIIATDADARPPHPQLQRWGEGCRTGQHDRVNDALCAALRGLRNITGGPALRVIREPVTLAYGFAPRPESVAAIRGQAAALMHIPVRGVALVAHADAMPGVDARCILDVVCMGMGTGRAPVADPHAVHPPPSRTPVCRRRAPGATAGCTARPGR